MYQPIETLKEYIEPNIEPTMEDKFIKICLDALDTEVTPNDEIPDDLACAQTLATLLKKIFPDFPDPIKLASTRDLDFKLFTDKRFERVSNPQKGGIIISPRTATITGHCGAFITTDRIASNDSKSGLFQGNYDWSQWINEFKEKRGLKIYIYKIKN